MSLDSRYVAPGVSLVTRKFIDNSGDAMLKDRTGITEENGGTIKKENPYLFGLTEYFADQLLINPGGTPSRDFVAACSVGMIGVASFTHNALVDAIPTRFTSSGLPYLSRDSAERVKTKIRKSRPKYKSEKGCNCLICYSRYVEHPRFTDLNPELDREVILAARDVLNQDPLPEWLNYEGMSSAGAIIVYELLAGQGKVYQLEDQIRH